MTRSQLISAQQAADQDTATTPAAAVGGTSIRILGRDRDGPGLLSSIPTAEFGFLISVRDRVYVHVSTDDDGMWGYVPLDA